MKLWELREFTERMDGDDQVVLRVYCAPEGWPRSRTITHVDADLFVYVDSLYIDSFPAPRDPEARVTPSRTRCVLIEGWVRDEEGQ